jgi:adenylosuccinate lyase
VIARYSLGEMRKIWSEENKWNSLLKVEVEVAHVEAQLGIIPKAAATAIAKKSKFDIKKINEIEKTTKHDVIAFVTDVAASVGDHGRFVHFGLTSSDVLDTALSLQIQQAGGLVGKEINQLNKTLKRLIQKHKNTVCAGRTHGMFAEPTSFGQKMAGFLAELKRGSVRFERALDENRICKLSGAVGTYSNLPPEVEKRVAKRLELLPETVATQVVPRDRHASLLSSMALLGCFLERISTELRHLQRTEVSEVIEGFTAGQKGSSAMPHKKNPISAENLCGISRLLRSYALVGFENVALWHERDISHSSAERVVIPDAFMVLHYGLNRLMSLLQNIYVDESRMIENMELSRGDLFSSKVLLALVNSGLSREEAYALVQSLSHDKKSKIHLRQKILASPEASKRIRPKEVENIFSGKRNLSYVNEVISRVIKNKD